ncbi:MAG: hypothetical protein ABR910_09740 [Acidobacteriaceae bacterium]
MSSNPDAACVIGHAIAEHLEETIVGAGEKESLGIRARIVPIVAGFSTTQLIEKGAAGRRIRQARFE